MWWRIALERFQDGKRSAFAQLPVPQAVPPPGTVGRPTERHPAETWVTFFTEIERERADTGETGMERQ